MTDKKRNRMSLLDSLANAGAAVPPPPMMASNRALRSARDAVDNHNVWDLNPFDIKDDRVRDRLDLNDVADLRDAIEANGQTVPILVRRHPTEPDKYLLVYGARRLEAIRTSEKVKTVRALVASLDDRTAVTAQISENMARRDLSYIEKALFANQLVQSGYGTQSQVAEVLTVTKSSISMALAIVDMVGTDLIEAIGPAHNVGRPRWEALGKSIQERQLRTVDLVNIALEAHDRHVLAPFTGDEVSVDSSQMAFDAVEKIAVKEMAKPEKPKPAQKGKVISIDGLPAGAIERTSRGLRIDLNDRGFADWLQAEAEPVITELHARWMARRED